MADILHQLIGSLSHVIYEVVYIPGGCLGCLPSTVSCNWIPIMATTVSLASTGTNVGFGVVWLVIPRCGNAALSGNFSRQGGSQEYFTNIRPQNLIVSLEHGGNPDFLGVFHVIAPGKRLLIDHSATSSPS